MRTNGCGPQWMKKWEWSRKLKNAGFDWFHEASCHKHDIGYTKGGSELRRWECDTKFLLAMLRDSRRLTWYYKPVAWAQAGLFYSLVVLGGWSSFNYRGKYD